jgi:hypothetical protein
MTHDELLAEIDSAELGWYYGWMKDSLRAVVELHKPELDGLICGECTASESEWYPCPTIQAIEKELK